MKRTPFQSFDSVFLFCQVSDRLEECKCFESNWMNAIHICEVSAEAAYNSGMFINWPYLLQSVKKALLVLDWSRLWIDSILIFLQGQSMHARQQRLTCRWHSPKWRRLERSQEKQRKNWLRLKQKKSREWLNMCPALTLMTWKIFQRPTFVRTRKNTNVFVFFCNVFEFAIM